MIRMMTDTLNGLKPVKTSRILPMHATVATAVAAHVSGSLFKDTWSGRYQHAQIPSSARVVICV